MGGERDRVGKNERKMVCRREVGDMKGALINC